MSHPVFVLSAGRTGTVFLTRTLPARIPALHAVHEPPGARSLLMAGNLRALTGRGGAWLAHDLAHGLTSRMARCPDGHRYVEINPMLCPLTDLLADLVSPLHVVHLVRHPVSWTRSIRAFKASGWRRHLIDAVPFANPAPAPRPAGWLGFDPVQQALWRWRACNEAIEAIAPRCAAFTQLRYEDLFLAPTATREATLRRLIDALGVPAPDDLAPLLEAPRANRAPEAEPLSVPALAVERITGPLLERYGYEADGRTLPGGSYS
jgi:hypothetical protein